MEGTSDQGSRARSPHYHGAGDLVVPGLAFRVEYHPDEAQAGYEQGQEATQGAHDCRRPVDWTAVQPHYAQVTDDAADRGAPQFPHDGTVGGEQQQKPVQMQANDSAHNPDQYGVQH